MTPGEPARAGEVVNQARSLPNGRAGCRRAWFRQRKHGIPTRGAYRLVDVLAALLASTADDDRARLEGAAILPHQVTGTGFRRAFFQQLRTAHHY
jgi:hypothetical protein